MAIVTLLAAARASWACEDEHPPVATTPVSRFQLQAAGGERSLSLAFDPRGLVGVEPADEDGERWIDSDNATGVWHYREWQWWKGHPWGESCRPRYYAKVDFEAKHQKERAAVITYRIDGFDCRQTFLLPQKAQDPDTLHWDLITTVRNASGEDVEEYGQFFASYTPVNRGRSFWYWDESGRLVRFADRGVTHLDGYVAHPQAYFAGQGSIPHCPRGGGKIVGRWYRPVLVSQASPAGWRSIVMLEAKHAAGLAQGIEGQAMDYIHACSAQGLLSV